MDFFGVGEQARCAVGDDCAVFPRIPVTHDDFHELVGSVVAAVMLAAGDVAHVQGLSPSFIEATMFQARGRGWRRRGRLGMARSSGGEGGAEAEALRCHAHDGQDGDRVTAVRLTDGRPL
jgi:hypothetical protein